MSFRFSGIYANVLAEQRKNDLIVYLAHDLKTPLASVIGYLNLLHDEGKISDELRERYLSISLDKAERLEDLINEFFEIAKYNLSTITLQYSRINLTRLFEMLLYEFQPMFNEKNLTCNLSIAEDTMLRCDANKLQRVFDNLLRNAVIYSYDGSVIDITVITQGENLVITFTNHGDPILEEKLERLFEQFYRLDDSRSTSSGGAGLGLAIAKQIIELHNRTVVAKCENEKIEFAKMIFNGNFTRGFNNIIGNIFVFAPLGYFLPLLFSKCKRINTVILVGFIISFLFETCQYLLYLGSADIDDIILNLPILNLIGTDKV